MHARRIADTGALARRLQFFVVVCALCIPAQAGEAAGEIGVEPNYDAIWGGEAGEAAGEIGVEPNYDAIWGGEDVAPENVDARLWSAMMHRPLVAQEFLEDAVSGQKFLQKSTRSTDDRPFRHGWTRSGLLTSTTSRITDPSGTDGLEVPSPGEKRVEVFGLQNTGTNLMVHMLNANFGSRLVLVDGALTQKHAGIWKHANLKVKSKFDPGSVQELQDRGIKFLFMVRNPLSWLQSMHKAPYELKNCTEGQDWIVKPCLHPVAGGFHSNTPRIVYPSVATIWSKWVEAYHNITPHLFVRYESLVEMPDREMDRIAKFLGLSKPEQGWRSQNASAKTHGDSHGRAQALHILKTKSYLDLYTPDEKVEACARLNRTLMVAHFYRDCESRHPRTPGRFGARSGWHRRRS